jgi:hypothetical protein
MPASLTSGFQFRLYVLGKFSCVLRLPSFLP